MLNKIIKILTPIILIVIIIVIGFETYKNTLDKKNNPLSIIPTNSSLILQLNNLNQTTKNLNKYDIWDEVSSINIFENLKLKSIILIQFFKKILMFSIPTACISLFVKQDQIIVIFYI